MRVALFTHHFLEPTHHAIAQVIEGLTHCAFTVYAKRFENHFRLPNVVDRITYRKGVAPGLSSEFFDVAHAVYDGKTAIRAAMASQEAKLPFVLSYHGGFDVHVKIHDPRYREATRLITEAAAAVTVPCRGDIDRLRAIGVQRSIRVVPVPIDFSRLPVATRIEGRRLVAVSRLVPKKGVDIAISALVRLPTYELIVVGDGELRSQLEEHARDVGVRERVRFLGLLPLDSVLELLRSAFALVHPARIAPDGNAEGTPQAVLWAQAMGVPVIASRSGSLEEIVEDGRNGRLVPTEDPDGIAIAVKELEHEPLLRDRWRRGVELSHHSIERVVQNVATIYRDALRSAA